jgi:uncharacterized membrane protein YdfJ with MMPL/SSD domain
MRLDNIFLSARIREESRRLDLRGGTLHALAVTGGVITAAGIVLAGTFAALTQIPQVSITEVGTAVALGVLLDTLIVRTVLVPRQPAHHRRPHLVAIPERKGRVGVPIGFCGRGRRCRSRGSAESRWTSVISHPAATN